MMTVQTFIHATGSILLYYPLRCVVKDVVVAQPTRRSVGIETLKEGFKKRGYSAEKLECHAGLWEQDN